MSHDSIGGLWDDLRVLSTARNTGASAPATTAFRGNLNALSFTNVGLREIFLFAQLPHSYKEGSDVKMHIHWAHTSAVDNGLVVWKYEYSWANTGKPGDAFPAATTGDSGFLPVYGTEQYKNKIIELATLTGTDKKISSEIMVRLFRDPGVGADNCTVPVFLLELDFHFQQDASGSWGEATK